MPTKVFISWSGERSRQVASALRDLLPEALQDLDTWMSEHDIAAGARWGQELTSQLSESRIGVICLAPENLSAPWLLFEAGALAKSITESRVIPYRFGLSSADVVFPLAQFQGVDADEEGTRRLLLSLNAVRERPMPEERLERIFLRWWPDFSLRMNSIPTPPSSAQVKQRDDRALLEEILQLVRRQQAPPPIQHAADDRVPKDLVWKTIHSVTDAEMEDMDIVALRSFIAAMRTRWNSVSGGEELHLEDRIDKAEALLGMREAELLAKQMPNPSAAQDG